MTSKDNFFKGAIFDIKSSNTNGITLNYNLYYKKFYIK